MFRKMSNIKRNILDLCGGTGAWSQPYVDAGYEVTIVDPLNGGLTVAEYRKSPDVDVFGVLAAPPCTEYSGSGARWWKNKNPQLLADANQVVRDCLAIIELVQPIWWCMENPVGRLARCVPELGKWRHTFQPTDYGDNYSKRTCLWGEFVMPPKAPVARHPDPKIGQPVWWASPGPERQRLRSMTPPGFANAFAKSNP
jgi:hypothetical protein